LIHVVERQVAELDDAARRRDGDAEALEVDAGNIAGAGQLDARRAIAVHPVKRHGTGNRSAQADLVRQRHATARGVERHLRRFVAQTGQHHDARSGGRDARGKRESLQRALERALALVIARFAVDIRANHLGLGARATRATCWLGSAGSRGLAAFADAAAAFAAALRDGADPALVINAVGPAARRPFAALTGSPGSDVFLIVRRATRERQTDQQ
jgi:hypothetical protein